MAATPIAADVSAVLELVGDIVAMERQRARRLAGSISSSHTEPPASNAAERKFFFVAAYMLSAKMEADKWEPLVGALQNYRTIGNGIQKEIQQVWTPVYQVVKAYKEARFDALDDGRASSLADPSNPTASPASGSTSRQATHAGMRACGSALDGSASGNARSKAVDPASLLLPIVVPRHSGPYSYDDLIASLQASTIGVYGVSMAAPASGSSCTSGPGSEATSCAAQLGPPPSAARGCTVGDRDNLRYDRALLVRTARVLQTAVTDMDALAMERIEHWTSSLLNAAEREAGNERLGTVHAAASVTSALDHTAVEIQKQIVAVDSPHEDLFAAMNIEDDGPANAGSGRQ